MATKRARAEFVKLMKREIPTATTGVLEEVVRLAGRHHAICERECNGHQTAAGDWDEEAAKRDEKKSERIEAAITALCRSMGCEPVFSGDPRGATVKIKVPSGYSDSWGGEGVCVPQ